MKKLGRKHRPFYRICAMDIRTPRDGRVLEELGTYDPMVPETDARALLKAERIQYWLSVGAQPSDKVRVLIKKYGAGGDAPGAAAAGLGPAGPGRRRAVPQRSRPPSGCRAPAEPAPSRRRPRPNPVAAACSACRPRPTADASCLNPDHAFRRSDPVPRIFQGYLGQSLLKQAIDAGLVEVQLHNIRDWAEDKHKKVDDRPFGGGPGMVLMVEPVVAVRRGGAAQAAEPGHLVMLTPQGRRLDQAASSGWPPSGGILLLCGRYEGFDERIRLLLGAGGDFHRRLRPQRGRSGRHGDHRRGDPAGAGRAGRRRVEPGRFVLREPSGCWSSPSTPGRGCTAGWKCPRCCSAATTARSPAGGERTAASGPQAPGRFAGRRMGTVRRPVSGTTTVVQRLTAS